MQRGHGGNPHDRAASRKGVQSYVARVKEYGRSTKRHSNFYIGMYAQKWINIALRATIRTIL